MRIALIITSFLILFSSCEKKMGLDPSEYLSEKEQMDFKIDLSRYIERLPPQTTMETRWDTAALKFYRYDAELMNLVKLYKDDHGYYYFYITRIVPSIRQGDRRAVAGKCKFEQDRISEIEEFFVSTIENPKVLEEASEELLKDVIKENKAPKNPLVEWPNEYFYYNKSTLQWDRVSSKN